MLNKEYLHSLFNYIDGNLVWKVARQKVAIGSTAGYVNPNGYKYITLDRKRYKAHRLIFMYHYGYFPKEIDHIDRNKLNNRIENLQDISHSDNCKNMGLKKNNTSGVKNVSFIKSRNRYEVCLKINQKKISFGYYKDLNLAELVAIEARDKYYRINKGIE
jgi:hypothetical protein